MLRAPFSAGVAMPTPDAALERPDPTRLSEHLRQGAGGPLHRLRCLAEGLHGFLAPRFVTTLGLTALIVAVGWVLLV